MLKNRPRSAFVLVLVAGSLVVGCAAPTAVRPQAAAITSGISQSASASSSGTPAAVGDATSVQECQAFQEKDRASLGAGAANLPKLAVTAGFATTVGAVHRYADTIGVDPADPGASPPPFATQDADHTSISPATMCIIDGTIDGPGPPGHAPYTREMGLLLGDGTFQALVLGQPKDIPLKPPS